MVSKILKKIATNHKPMSVKSCCAIRRRHRRNCSVKKAAANNSSVVLTRIGAYRGCKILQPVRREIRHGTRIRNPLPPLNSPDKRTVILDLDETLVHSVTGPPPKRFDFVVRPTIRGKIMTFYVAKRPGVDAFLEKLAAKYEVVVFTAGLREYATLVLDRLDRKRVVSHRLYRDSCKEVNGKFVKDLSGLGRDLRRSVIVDDNPNAYRLHPENAVPVRPFIDDRSDRELGRLLEFFEDVSNCCRDDIRVNVKKFVGGDDGYVSSDDEEENDDGGDGVVAEVSDGKTKLSVLTVFRPCPFVSVHKLNPFGMPLVLDFPTKMVILCCLFLLIVDVILCFRTGDFF